MDHTHQFPVEKMCKVLKVSRSGYYKWLKNKSDRSRKTEELSSLILYHFERSRGTYGSPRIAQSLLKEGYTCSKSKVARLMRKMGLVARKKLRYITTTNSNHTSCISPNLLDRQFYISEPSTVWVSDITYIRVSSEWMYLTVVIDLADRMVVGWSLSSDMSANQTIVAAFKNAVKFREPSCGMIFHSDRGVQYASHEFRSLISSYHVQQSMSRKGDCWDNAVAESFFKTLKVECIYKQKICSQRMAYRVIFDYILGWYNTVRIHSSLGGISPLQAYIQMSKQNKAA